MHALHNNQIIHRDIKPANIFITENNIIKIGDFNVGKFNADNLAQTKIGTPLTMSPEVLNSKQYDFKADIWSLGCVIYEMATLHPLFDAACEAALYGKHSKKTIVVPSDKKLECFLRKLIKYRPEKRPSCAEILAMEEFKRFRKEDPEKNNSFRQRIHKSKTSTRVPSLINLSISKDLSMRKNMHKSPTTAKLRRKSEIGNKTPINDILKPIFKFSYEGNSKKPEISPEISPEKKSFRNNLSRDFSFRLIDVSDIPSESSKNLCMKNIAGLKAASTPKIISKIFNKFPISFTNKAQQLNYTDKKIALRNTNDKKSLQALHAPRSRQAAGVYLNEVYAVKPSSIHRKKSVGSFHVSSLITPKPLSKISSQKKVFIQLTSK